MAELKLSDEQFNALVSRICTHGWIPTKERMPEDDSFVIVCTANGNVLTGCRGAVGDMRGWLFVTSSPEWAADTDDKPWHKVIAWQPLPEPYKEEA